MTTVVNPDAVWPGENFFVCFKNQFGNEMILQSEKSSDRADYSVEVLNEHERNNARREKFYWRSLEEGEVIPRGKRRSMY